MAAIQVLDTKLGGKNQENHSNHSAVYHSIANTYQQDSILPDALKYAQKALDEEKAKDIPNPYELSSVLSNIATIYLDMCELEETLKFIDDAIKKNGDIDLENSENTVLCAYNGNILSALNRYEEANDYFDIVKDFREKHLSSSHPDSADLLLRILRRYILDCWI